LFFQFPTFLLIKNPREGNCGGLAAVIQL